MGGGECEECGLKKRTALQPKLKVSKPGDIYEQEADRVADQVMTASPRSAVSSAPPRIQRVAGQTAGQASTAPASVNQVLANPGSPLGPALRRDMEQRFGYDFSHVRVHSGAAAERSAEDVNANAYTVGRDIVFGAGLFAPGTHRGRRLIAHELTHVVQQSGAVGGRVRQANEKHGHSPDIPLSVATSGVVQRSPADETAADYEEKVKAGTWCRDTKKTGQFHGPNVQCYREIPPSQGYEGGMQFCFDKETGKYVESSPDFISAVSGQKKDGSCDIPVDVTDPPNPFTKRGRRALGHGVADVCKEDPRLCGTVYGGLAGVAMGIALPKEGLDFGFSSLAIPSILGFFGGALSRWGMPKLNRLAIRHGFLPTISLGVGSNIGLGVGMGVEKRDRPLPLVPINTYITFSLDSSLAVKDESTFLAKVGVRIDPRKQGGLFALGSLGAGVALGSDVSGAISADVGVGFRAADFFDVQLVHQTLIGDVERGGTYWVTVKVVAPQRALEGHK